MLTRVLLAAIVAGVLAGGFSTAAQSFRVTPLILEAEKYEVAAAPHTHEAGASVNSAMDGKAAADATAHSDEPETWAPADGLERTLFTLVSNVLAGVAFSLILTAGILLANQAVTLQTGLVWGVCGFAVFVLAPNFGLPPELPGMAAAGLLERQLWWLATVVLTAAGLWIFAFKRGLSWMALGVGLVLAMHVYGAPRPAVHETAVPANLAADFVIATVVTSALFWTVLGGLLGLMLSRAIGREQAA